MSSSARPPLRPRWTLGRLAAVATSAVVAATIAVPPTDASVPPEWRQEAEAFTTKTVGARFGDANASGGAAWNIWTNGYIQTTFTAGSTGAKQVDVVARGDVADGVWPVMRVYYDTTLVHEHAVSSATYRTYSTTLPSVTVGVHALKIEFGNDAIVGGQDRNLKVDVVSVLPSGITQFIRQAELFDYRPTETGQSFNDGAASGLAAWNLHSNGHIEHTFTLPASGTKQLNVTAKGDPLGGVWPNMRVSIDGQAMPDRTVGTSTWQTYSFTTTLSKGSHTLRLQFLNDAKNATEDRNLRLDIATIVPVANEWKQEAESFTTPGPGQQTSTPLASAGKFWNLWSNGSHITTMTAASAGRKTIELVARGAHANNIYPIVRIYVGSTLVATRTIDSATFTPYVFTASMSAGTNVLKIEYINNDTNLGGGDRNVHLDVATLLGDNAYPFVQGLPSPADNAYIGHQSSLRATYADPDGDAGFVDFEVYTHPAGALAASGRSASTAAGGVASWTPGPTALNHGQQYRWRARAYDGTSYAGAWTADRFVTVDSLPPVAPGVWSTTFPAGAWSGTHTTSGVFTFSPGTSNDVVGYKYGVDVSPPVFEATGTSVTFTPGEGRHTLYVQSVDRAGNLSQITPYAFSVGSGAVTSPREGDATGKDFVLRTAANPTLSSVTYQWRRAETDSWAPIPTGHVTANSGFVAWPLALSDGSHDDLTWHANDTLGGVDGPVEVRAVYDSGATTHGTRVTLDQRHAGGAMHPVGSGAVNLLTGNLSLGVTDAAIAGIEVVRTYNSRDPQAGATGAFGPGWTSALSVSSTGHSYATLTRSGSLVTVTQVNGDTIGFTAASADVFMPEEGLESLSLMRTAGSATPADNTDDVYELGDLAGFTTVFAWQSPTFVPTRIEQPGNDVATTLTWETAGGVARVVRAVAPVPTGVNCATPATTRGCKSVTFDYAPAGTPIPGPSGGDYPGRVRSVSLTAWNPATSAMATVELARWSYDPTGRLLAAWDPALAGLKTTYAYDAAGRLTTITPPAEEPYTLTYTTLPNDPDGGRLASVSRSALSAGTATTTFVYGVPLTGSGAPADLSASQRARWGQTSTPVYGTAVFPPTQVPTGNQATGTMPSSYDKASVYYVDVTGRVVDELSPGGHLAAVEHDEHGNIVREITAANRARALNSSATDTAAEEAALAARLSSIRVFAADGQRLVEELGPEHEVTLTDPVTDSLGRAWAAGALVRARARTVNTYDEGAPAGTGPYHLVTTSRTGARIAETTTDADVRTAAATYDWSLRRPLTTTVDPGGLNLVTRRSYDAATGQVTRSTSPGGTAAQDTAHTTVYSYYTSGTHPTYTECGNRPEWANLRCRIDVAAQPTTPGVPPIPSRRVQYDYFGAITMITESASVNVLRTWTAQYDAAHRPWRSSVTATTGESLQTIETYYDPVTGREAETRSIDVAGAVTARVTRAYDTLGRMTSYTDADGNVSTTTYNVLSQPVITNDGKATQTRYYDEGTERRGLLSRIVDSAAGTFSATYDADGQLATETLPNGLVRTTTRNESGGVTRMTYTKSGSTWLSFAATESIHGQRTTATASGLSSQEYGYDAGGRLVRVADTPAGLGCTLRTYVFDAETNRTSVTTREPDSEGACDAGAAGSTTTFTYDEAARLTTTGYAYDALGRTTTVPPGDAGGKELTATYFVNDLVRSLTPQDDVTTTWTLDPTQQRFRSWTRNGVKKVNHYAGDGDSPAWIDEGGTAWTRNVSGIDGALAAIQDSAGGVLLQLTDLHGDVVATATTDPLATGMTATFGATELGASRDGTVRRYGWLGAQQRPADASGAMLMGVRLYNPSTGRFLQVDPVSGGSANRYEYGLGDPVNKADPTGRYASCANHSSLCKKYSDHGKTASAVYWGFSAKEIAILQSLMMAWRSNNLDPRGLRWGYSSDFCTGPGAWVDWAFRSAFNNACARHDFGWMNSRKIFGDWGARTWGFDTTNGVFLEDMRKGCNSKYAWWNPLRDGCYGAALVVYAGVRNAIGAGYYWYEYGRQ